MRSLQYLNTSKSTSHFSKESDLPWLVEKMSPIASTNGEGDEKTFAQHDEVVAEEINREQTPWQCMRLNPKIVLWSLFANRKWNLVYIDSISFELG